MPQMHIHKMELTETIDAIEFALLVLNAQVEQAQIGGMIATRTITVLQSLKLAYTLAAAKEQRKDRANEVASHSEFATTNKRLDNALRLMIR